jgi:hypothetical protein
MQGGRWYDAGFDIVCTPDRETAARLGRVPLAAVRGPYASPDAIRRARALRDTMASRRGGRPAQAR